MKIGFLYDGRPLQGLSSGTAGQGSFFLIFTHQSAAGASLRRQGAVAIIVSDGEGGKNPASSLNTTIFTGKISTGEMFLKKPERSRADPVKIY